MFDLKGKVCLVTGGAAGIGARSAKAFLEEGAKHVAILDLDAKNGAAIEKELSEKYGSERVRFHKCDVTTEELMAAYDSILEQLGYIDVVLNCAGILNDHPKVYDKAIAINVTALIKSSLRAFNIMRKDKGGRGGTIINISSIAALMPGGFIPIYNATKSAVLHFSTSLGHDLNHSTSGVRVVTICFGCTDTELLTPQKAAAFDDSLQEGFLAAVETFPMQTPENAVRGLVEAYKQGASASTWLITSNRPAKDITENITQAYEIMGRGVLD